MSSPKEEAQTLLTAMQQASEALGLLAKATDPVAREASLAVVASGLWSMFDPLGKLMRMAENSSIDGEYAGVFEWLAVNMELSHENAMKAMPHLAQPEGPPHSNCDDVVREDIDDLPESD